MAGVSLVGGLLKQTGPQGTEYLGMLLGRFAVYGLTVYGGYGEGKDAQNNKFTAFFAIGAVNGPIGGPPAFFLTGIGGGFGINRKLLVPTDLAKFGEYPLIQALDIAAKPSDPMAQLRQLGDYFPMNKGTFWFAAGLSFNSFALVDGIAVVGVQVGDGLDINLLGLARMALPRPQVALVSIEVALLVRFSSSEGVLWVQGQLTDNSWLLYPDIKLTGGFAYVIWFKGERAGEFVFTLGGYHPDFHRDGYPVVPRLGLRWSIGSAITIKAGSYFALTSEALMAGGDFEASAKLGPGWAELTFGAHGIVFFDPFSYDVKAYVRIRAGVTIDTWLFGVITISVSLGARIHVQGPDFRGEVTFEVGPIELTFRFGESDRAQREPLSGEAFIAKYLDAADNGKARPHAVMTNTGALPSKGEQSTPDGSSARPFVVVVEFSITLTSQVPGHRRAPHRRAGDEALHHAPAEPALGVAPRNVANVEPELKMTWLRGGVEQAWPFVDQVRPFGRFPLGVWGQPQDPNQRKLPKGKMVDALSELDHRVGRGAVRWRPGNPVLPGRDRTAAAVAVLAQARRREHDPHRRRLGDGARGRAGERQRGLRHRGPVPRQDRVAHRARRTARRAPGAAARRDADRGPGVGHRDRGARRRRGQAGQGVRSFRRRADRGGAAGAGDHGALRVARARARAHQREGLREGMARGAADAREGRSRAQPFDRRQARARRRPGSGHRRPRARRGDDDPHRHRDRRAQRAAHGGGARRDGARRAPRLGTGRAAGGVRQRDAAAGAARRQGGGVPALPGPAPPSSPARPWCWRCRMPMPTPPSAPRARSSSCKPRSRAWCCSAPAACCSPTSSPARARRPRRWKWCAAPNASSPSAWARRRQRARRARWPRSAPRAPRQRCALPPMPRRHSSAGTPERRCPTPDRASRSARAWWCTRRARTSRCTASAAPPAGSAAPSSHRA